MSAVEPGQVEIAVNQDASIVGEPDEKIEIVWPKLTKLEDGV